jgi:2-polyprenyl-3-methyl-5-hydroxy-6-metoxy-1,4-benzoquinol methylase
MSNYRQDLFSSYHIRTVLLDRSAEEKLDWFRWYFEENYRKHLPEMDILTSLKILDIGCNRGYLLRVLSDLGCEQLHGIDLSPVDLEAAKNICPSAMFTCVDAFEYLEKNKSQFSLIFIKAVLEHIPKEKVMPLIEAMYEALEPGGKLIIDVPNMDWLFAAHERYMDFTHEIGFTQQSLAQVMHTYFDTISIHPIETSKTTGLLGLLKRNISRLLISAIFRASQTDWQGDVVWCRALLGIGIKK